MSGRTYSVIVAIFILVTGLLFLTPATAAASEPVTGSNPNPVSEVSGLDVAAQDGEANGDEADSNLPPGINSIIASLGIYILTLFTMALGTEIAVDVVKQLFGLKSKPTAREAIEEFEDLLPGNLSELGVSIEAREKLQRQIRDIKTALQPFVTAEDLIQQLRQGELKTAVESILQEVNALPEEQTVDELIETHLRQVVGNIGADFGLEDYIVNTILGEVNEAIAGVTLDDVQQRLTTGISSLRAELVTAWLRRQFDQIETSTRSRIEREFNTTVRPRLADLGFSQEEEAAIREWFENFLTEVELYSGRQVDIYLDSLNQLLIGVERQRYFLQSPARRAWRRLYGLDNWLGALLRRLEAMWNKLLGRTKEEIHDFTHLQLIRDATSTAQTILELERQHKADAAGRVRLIRTLAVIVAIYLAYVLQIDSADLLEGLLPSQTTGFLSTVLIAEGTTVMGFTFVRNLTAGIILTGLAASAGSSFWHDRLSQLQSVQQTAEAAAGVLQQVTTTQKERQSG